MLRFLYVPEDEFAVDEAAAAKQLGDTGRPVIDAAISALEPLTDWAAAGIEEALRVALVDGLGLKPRNAFGPVRVAITGSTVSPPLFESMELLGRDRSLERMRAALG
jgi:glutamyl-tRNA synthetase